ncbi:kinase-like domain-containing protein [Tanacetum coccineum]
MSSPNHDDLAHLKIPLGNILSATNNFAGQYLSGEDAFEKDYKAQLLWLGELINIFVRRLKKKGFDGDQEFWMEISFLSRLKHKNLVSLVGFCDENDEKIIIIRRENRGRLSNYLSDPMLLTWVRRLEISVGIAQALSYIYYDEPHNFSVIHRSICSRAILLNDDWEPKLYFFDFSMKIEASQWHLSNHIIQHAPGFAAPIYIKTKSVNHKSDMNSFGILLFELLCGRKAVIDDKNNKYLAPLAMAHYREKTLHEMIDPDLWNQMDSQSFNMFAEIAYHCLNQERSEHQNIDEIS